MTTFLLYDLKVAVLIAVFYMFYRLLVAYDTFHRLNRIVLLSSLALSAVLPLCVITLHEVVEVASSSPVVAEAGFAADLQAEPAGNDWEMVLAVVFFLGVFLTLARTLYNLYSVRRLMKSCREVAVPAYVRGCPPDIRLLVSDNEKISPFSWMKTVVLSRKDYEQDLVDGSEGHSIVLAHECGHVACRHSADMLFVDVIAALQWFNPVVWLLRQDLRIVHEYEADARVLSQGFNAYQYLNYLVLKAAGNAGYSIANGISTSSVLSKRVKMMVKDKSSRYSWVKVLYVVPIVAISLAATAKTVVEYRVKEAPKAETPERLADFDAKGQEIALSGDDGKLYVVDGNIISKGEMMKLDSEEIESVSVIGGESATKIWGERGANGAVMIRTKEAKVSESKDENAFDNSLEKPLAGDSVLMISDQMPQFAGGDKAMMEYLMQNVKYPAEAQKKGAQGRVVVSFVVEKDGSLSEVKVARSVDPLLDEEAVRVVKSMPNWMPGKQKGKPVRVKFNVPIAFKLDKPVATADGQNAPAVQPSASSDEKMFDIVEDMPQFPGGDKALMDFVAKNVRYPKEAQEKGIQGRVIVQFIVEKDGTVSNATVAKSNRFVAVEVSKNGTVETKLEKSEESATPALEAEALRVVNLMPKWSPGKQKGKPVRVKFNVPLNFRLQ